MYNGRQAMVQPRHGLAHVAEDLEHFRFREAHTQALVHLVDHIICTAKKQREFYSILVIWQIHSNKARIHMMC